VFAGSRRRRRSLVGVDRPATIDAHDVEGWTAGLWKGLGTSPREAQSGYPGVLFVFAVGWVMYRLDFKGLHFDLVVTLPRRRGPRDGEAVAALLEAAGHMYEARNFILEGPSSNFFFSHIVIFTFFHNYMC
jgi:hypothetical protein